MSQVEYAHPLSDVPPPRRRLRWRFWIAVVLLLGLLWLVIAYVLFVLRMDGDLRDAMAEADRESPDGWQLADIEAHRRQLADDENAALVAMKVKSLLPATWPLEIKDNSDAATAGQESWDQRLMELSPEIQLDADLLTSLRASLARVEPARVEARKLIGMT